MEEDIPKISLSNEELRNQIEAVLFASGRRLGVDFLKEITEVNNAGRIRKALEEIRDWYEKNSGVLMLTEDAGLWKLNVREKYSDIVRKIISETELSKAVLETLSVIAWKAPVLQSEVVDIRTSQAYDHIKDLLEAGFITKERHGRSYIIKINQKFFDYFDIEGAEGIKEVFKKIKEQPIQRKVDEEYKEEEREGDKVGDLEVIEVAEEKEKKEGLVEEEKIGKLKVYELSEKEEKTYEDFFSEKEKAIDELSNDELLQLKEEAKSEKESGEEDSTRAQQLASEILEEPKPEEEGKEEDYQEQQVSEEPVENAEEEPIVEKSQEQEVSEQSNEEKPEENLGIDDLVEPQKQEQNPQEEEDPK